MLCPHYTRYIALRPQENYTRQGLCSHIRTVITGRFLKRSEAALTLGSQTASSLSFSSDLVRAIHERGSGEAARRHQSRAWPFACLAFCSQFIGIVAYRIGFCHSSSQCERVNRTVAEVTGELQQRRRRPQRERQNSDRFNQQDNTFARASHFFVHFFAVTARLQGKNA